MTTLMLVLSLIAVVLVLVWMAGEMFSLSLTGCWLWLSGGFQVMWDAMCEIVAELGKSD